MSLELDTKRDQDEIRDAVKNGILEAIQAVGQSSPTVIVANIEINLAFSNGGGATAIVGTNMGDIL